jgi:hypothetical protein
VLPAGVAVEKGELVLAAMVVWGVLVGMAVVLVVASIVLVVV